MIVSDLESLLARLLLGGVLAAAAERRLSMDGLAATRRFLLQCREPGTTPAAAEELEAGGAVRRL